MDPGLSSPPFSIVIYSFLTAQMDAAPSATSSKSPSESQIPICRQLNENEPERLFETRFEVCRLKRDVWFSVFSCLLSRVLRKSDTKTVRTMFYACFTPCGGRIMTDRTSDSLPQRYPQEIFANTVLPSHWHTQFNTNTTLPVWPCYLMFEIKKKLWRLLNHFEAVYIHSALGDCLGRHMCVVLSI